MHITQFGHLAFNCKDLSRSVHFYRDLLGLKKKFSITYGDILEDKRQKGTAVSPEEEQRLSDNRDKDWIVYIETGSGAFIELFDGSGQAEQPTVGHASFTHIALIVEDIFAAEQSLKNFGIPIDTPPKRGLDHTWQMWARDPDGNRIEFMQYTPESWQLTGR